MIAVYRWNKKFATTSQNAGVGLNWSGFRGRFEEFIPLFMVILMPHLEGSKQLRVQFLRRNTLSQERGSIIWLPEDLKDRNAGHAQKKRTAKSVHKSRG